jgi:hypothetical protein
MASLGVRAATALQKLTVIGLAGATLFGIGTTAGLYGSIRAKRMEFEAKNPDFLVSHADELKTAEENITAAKISTSTVKKTMNTLKEIRNQEQVPMFKTELELKGQPKVKAAEAAESKQ